MERSCNLHAPPSDDAEAAATSSIAVLACPLLQRGTKGVYMDALYLAVTFAFFALSWGLIVLCEKL
jgi:hypothetical protein